MTATPEAGTLTASVAPVDRRGSPIPTFAMVATRFLELAKRRGLMIALIAVLVGLPTVFLAVRLILHAVAPKTYGSAGGYDIFAGLSSGVLYTFGFILAAALGAAAATGDLSDGMFRHLVVTGRSRLALYLARIPAGLAILAPLIAAGFAVVCAVCVLAAPPRLFINGMSVPARLSESQLETWAADHATVTLCHFPSRNITVEVECGPPPPGGSGQVRERPGSPPVPSTAAELRAAAAQVARQNYAEYRKQFLYPPPSLMVKTGLWIELEAAIGFLLGLGLASLIGQRTVTVVTMIVLEVILTPIALRTHIPHMVNLQRGVVGVATANLEPGQLPLVFGGGGDDFRVTESTGTAVAVILAWLLAWSVLGAWRMMTRDA
jgi:hypothetical protein